MTLVFSLLTRVSLSDHRRPSYFVFEMPGRHFPIVNQQSGLALEASNGVNAVVELKEYNGRDCQLWFKVDETIRSKVKQVQTKVRSKFG